MTIYKRLEISNSKPKFNYKYSTSSQEEYEKLLHLKHKYDLHIFVIKKLNCSITDYFLKNNIFATITNVEEEDSQIHVTVLKNDEYEIITIKKSDLKILGKDRYEFTIGCLNEPKLVNKDFNVNLRLSSKKHNVIYIND